MRQPQRGMGEAMNTAVSSCWITTVLAARTAAPPAVLRWSCLGSPTKTTCPDQTARGEELPALRAEKGLQQQAELGVNSFKYGLIASTDTHIAAPGLVMEKNFPGHGGRRHGSRDELPTGLPDDIEFGPGGLAVLYAEKNTGMHCSRPCSERGLRHQRHPPDSAVLRRLGLPEDLCAAGDQVARGYAGGVPMGRPAAAAGPGARPPFLVSAAFDPRYR